MPLSTIILIGIIALCICCALFMWALLHAAKMRDEPFHDQRDLGVNDVDPLFHGSRLDV